MVAAFNRNFRKVERDAQRTSKQVEREFSQGLGAIKDSAEKLSSLIGGPLGDIADVALDLGGKLSGTAGAIGGVGAAAGVAAISVAALAVGAKGLADSALEASERLQETGYAAVIPAEAAESLKQYEQASADLRRELDLLVVLVGSDVAKVMGQAAYATIGVIKGFRDLASAASDAAEPISSVGERLSWLSPLKWELYAAGKAFEYFRDEGKKAADELENTSGPSIEAAEAYSELGTTVEDAAIEEAKATRQAKERAGAAAEAAAAVEAQARAEEEQAEATRRAHEAGAEWLATGMDAIRVTDNLSAAVENNAYQWDLAVQNMGSASKTAGGLGAALGDSGEAVQTFGGSLQSVLESEAFTGIMGQMSKTAELAMQLHEMNVAQLQERIAKRREEISEWKETELSKVDAMLERGQIDQKQAIEARKRIAEEEAARRQALNQRTADERAKVIAGFKRGQAYQRAQATMEAASAALGLIPFFAFLGPLAPLAAAGVTAPALALQLEVINRQQPPQFPMGRAPLDADHTVMAAIQPTEAVLTARGVAAAGGAAGVRALNDGRGTMGGSVVVQLDRRVIAEAVAGVGVRRVDPRRGKLDPWRSA